MRRGARPNALRPGNCVFNDKLEEEIDAETRLERLLSSRWKLWIGLATAKVFVKEGARVYITAAGRQNSKRQATLLGPHATPVQGVSQAG